MSEDKQPPNEAKTEVKLESKADKAQTEELTTGEMGALEAPGESNAPKIPDAKAEKPADAPKAEAPPAETKAEAKPAEAKAPAEAPNAEEKPEPDARTTVTMAAVVVGTPPEVPAPAAAPPVKATANGVEDPTFMPGPDEVPTGSPGDPANAPGAVPAGDSRSFRRGPEFALVYRQGTAVISRFGAVGTRGQWRVVEYPTSSSASNAYAKECSRFVGEGFSDYRD